MTFRKWSLALSLLSIGAAAGLYVADLTTAEASTNLLPWMPTPDQVVEERIIDVPEDGDDWWTCVFTAKEPTTAERRIFDALDSDSQLKRLKAQTKLVHYVPGDHYYEAILKDKIVEMPAFLVQTNDGQVVYKRSGTSLINNIDRLGADIALAIKRWPCPRPTPTPKPPAPEPPKPEPKPAPIPDLTPETEPAKQEDSILPLILAVLGGGLGGVGYSMRKEM